MAKKEWSRTSCTLMSDSWTNSKSRSITNFLVNSPSGTIYWESVDTSTSAKSAKELFRLLDRMIQKVGADNSVQVVVNGTFSYVGASALLEANYQHIF